MLKIWLWTRSSVIFGCSFYGVYA